MTILEASCVKIVRNLAQDAHFGKLFLWKFSITSQETIILSASSVKFRRSLPQNDNFGSFFCEIWRTPCFWCFCDGVLYVWSFCMVLFVFVFLWCSFFYGVFGMRWCFFVVVLLCCFCDGVFLLWCFCAGVFLWWYFFVVFFCFGVFLCCFFVVVFFRGGVFVVVVVLFFIYIFYQASPSTTVPKNDTFLTINIYIISS